MFDNQLSNFLDGFFSIIIIGNENKEKRHPNCLMFCIHIQALKGRFFLEEGYLVSLIRWGIELWSHSSPLKSVENYFLKTMTFKLSKYPFDPLISKQIDEYSVSSFVLQNRSYFSLLSQSNEWIYILSRTALSEHCILTMFLLGLVLYFAAFHADQVLSLDCEYSSREYQVVLRPSIMMPAFKAGVTQVLDELTKIEQSGKMDFKVSVSSLKFKNVSFTEYVSSNIRDASDFYVPLRFKSRQKKVNEPADIVMKISNTDPEISCWPLKVNRGVFIVI